MTLTELEKALRDIYEETEFNENDGAMDLGERLLRIRDIVEDMLHNWT